MTDFVAVVKTTQRSEEWGISMALYMENQWFLMPLSQVSTDF